MQKTIRIKTTYDEESNGRQKNNKKECISQHKKYTKKGWLIILDLFYPESYFYKESHLTSNQCSWRPYRLLTDTLAYFITESEDTKTPKTSKHVKSLVGH